MKPKMKLPGTERWQLECVKVLSTSAFKFNLCHYTVARALTTEFAKHS